MFEVFVVHGGRRIHRMSVAWANVMLPRDRVAFAVAHYLTRIESLYRKRGGLSDGFYFNLVFPDQAHSLVQVQSSCDVRLADALAIRYRSSPFRLRDGLDVVGSASR